MRELGVTLDADTPRVKLTIGERQVEAYRIELPSLRFGKHVLEKVPFAVLPAREARGEARLGRSAWRGVSVELEVDRFEFKLTPSAGTLGGPR